MSWYFLASIAFKKGFKKAVNRLPYVLQTKTGHAEHTVDEEFQEYQSQFEELKQLSSKLHDAASKYKDAASAMLKHQESFAKTLQEVYEPISGRQFGSGSGLNPVDSSKKQRQLTREDSMQCAQAFHAAATDASQKLTPELEILIERRVVQPTRDWIYLHEQVQKTISKRERKRIDYDRHRETTTQAKERAATSSSAEDEKKTYKMESAMEMAYRDYEYMNSMLKQQLPHYIALRIAFVDPILEALIMFQDHFFHSVHQSFAPMESYVDMTLSVVEGYNRKKDHGLALLEDISVLQAKIESPIVASDDLDATEFDADVQQISGPPMASASYPAPIAAPSSNPSYYLPKNPISTQAPPSSTTSASPPTQPKPFSYGAPALKPKPVTASKPAFLASSPTKPSSSQNLFAKTTADNEPLPPYSSNPSSPLQSQAPTLRRNTGASASVSYAVALYDFQAQQGGDLSFRAGDRVEVLERTEDANGWWRGRVHGMSGIFPGNYVQIE